MIPWMEFDFKMEECEDVAKEDFSQIMRKNPFIDNQKKTYAMRRRCLAINGAFKLS
jgi:uncharacterized protein YpbB